MDQRCRSTLSWALGQQAVEAPNSVASQCLELRACGVFKRQQFLKGLQASHHLLQPEQLLHVVTELIQRQLFGLELLQALLPDPVLACHTLHKACSSYNSSQQLLQSCTGHSRSGSYNSSKCRAPAAVQLLQLLLAAAFDNADETAFSGGGEAAPDSDLQQYVQDLVQNLQHAAAKHEVLAVVLFQAAAACMVHADWAAGSRWLQQLLQDLLNPPAAHHSCSNTQQQASGLAGRAWYALPFTHSCWRQYIMPCLHHCIDPAVLLNLLQGCIEPAASSVQGLGRLCDALSGLRACGVSQAQAVHDMLCSLLASALKDGQLAALLPPLLLAQHMLGSTEYGQLLLEAASTGLAPGSASAAAGWSSLVNAITQTLPGAHQALLQAHLQLLQQLGPSASNAARQQIMCAVEMLQGATASMKQQEKKQQQQLAGGTDCPKISDGCRTMLRMFEQHAPHTGPDGCRRRLPEHYFKNKLYGPTWWQGICNAISSTPPDTPGEARLRWEYLKALEDYRMCPKDQIDRFLQLCSICGIDGLEVSQPGSSAAGSSGQQPKTAAPPKDPLDQLQQLLSKLPQVVASQQSQMTHMLLQRISTLLQQLHQQQQQRWQQQDSTTAGTGTGTHSARPAKRQCLAAASAAVCDAATAGGSADGVAESALCDRLVNLLVEVHDATIQLEHVGVDFQWRLGFTAVLQQAEWLHPALLQSLQSSVAGTRTGCDPRQVASHGRQLALMSALKPCQLLALQPGPGAAIVTSHDAAAAAYSWTLEPTAPARSKAVPSSDPGTSKAIFNSNSSAAGGPGLYGAAGAVGSSAGAGAAATDSAAALGSQDCEQLAGCALAAHFLGATCVGSAHQLCCAVAFWAGYLCEVVHMGRWCAGQYGPFSSQPDTSSATAKGGHPALLGFVPQQMPALMRLLAQQLSQQQQLQQQQQVALGGGSEQVDLGLVKQFKRVCNGVLSNNEPVKWVVQQYGA